MAMHLSDGEKLILVMLAEVHKALDIKGDIDPDLVSTAIFNNQAWSLKWELSGIFGDDEPSDGLVEETANILSMWRAIEWAYAKLDEAEKKRLDDEVPYGGGKDPKFEGFDGNNDKHHSIANHLVNRMGRFKEFKGRSLNSHSSASLHRYRRQLAARKAIEEARGFGDRHEIYLDDLVKILSA